MSPVPGCVRTWTCPDCSAIHDRDTNAARNILALATGAIGPKVMRGKDERSQAKKDPNHAGEKQL